MVLLAAQHWLVGSNKYRLQHSQMNIIACSCHDGEKGRKVVSLWQCGQTLRVRFQVSGYSWIRLVEYQWVFRSRIVITRAVIRVNFWMLLWCGTWISFNDRLSEANNHRFVHEVGQLQWHKARSLPWSGPLPSVQRESVRQNIWLLNWSRSERSCNGMDTRARL